MIGVARIAIGGGGGCVGDEVLIVSKNEKIGSLNSSRFVTRGA